MALDEYKRGFSDGLKQAIMCLEDYAGEARKDKRYQAANYLRAAMNRVAQIYEQRKQNETV